MDVCVHKVNYFLCLRDRLIGFPPSTLQAMSSDAIEVLLAKEILYSNMQAREVILLLPYLQEQEQQRVKDHYIAQMTIAHAHAEAICRQHGITIKPRPVTELLRQATRDNPYPAGKRQQVFQAAVAFQESMTASIFAYLQQPGVPLECLPAMPPRPGGARGFAGTVQFLVDDASEGRHVTVVSVEVLPVSPLDLLARLPHWVGQEHWQLEGIAIGPLTEAEAAQLQAFYRSESEATSERPFFTCREVAPNLVAGQLVLRYRLAGR